MRRIVAGGRGGSSCVILSGVGFLAIEGVGQCSTGDGGGEGVRAGEAFERVFLGSKSAALYVLAGRKSPSVREWGLWSRRWSER